MTKQTVSIHGREYEIVASRVNRFRTDKPDWAITTEILKLEGGECCIRASIIDEKGVVRATGIAHEKEGASIINKTSYVECCESSAIGRALACFNYQGGEYASADEVANAIANQGNKPVKEPSPAPKVALTVAQSLLKKTGDVFNLMAVVHDTAEREGKNKAPITDYKVSDVNSDTKSIISKYGKTLEGLSAGDVVLFKDVKVYTYQGSLTYLAKEAEKIGK